MLVFIDESGDPGFKIAKGASPIFVAAMVIFADGEAAAATQAAIAGSTVREKHRGEFKFSKCSGHVRDAFFEVVRHCPFRVRAIVVRKEVIYSDRLRTSKEGFYQYFVHGMLKHDNGTLAGARVVIDGSGDREFRKRLNSALRQRLRAGAIRAVSFKDSRSDNLVQLADMCAGAIARSYRKDRDDPLRWRNMLAPHINDVWDFL